MVTITNGIKTFRITTGAIKPYESMGFHVVSDKELKEMNQANQEHSDNSRMSGFTPKESTDISESIEDGQDKQIKSEEAIFIEELLEKPLTQWTNEEVKEFVKIKDIDTSGAQKVSQVRSIIKAYLEEQNKNA